MVLKILFASRIENKGKTEPGMRKLRNKDIYYLLLLLLLLLLYQSLKWWLTVGE